MNIKIMSVLMLLLMASGMGCIDEKEEIVIEEPYKQSKEVGYTLDLYESATTIERLTVENTSQITVNGDQVFKANNKTINGDDVFHLSYFVVLVPYNYDEKILEYKWSKEYNIYDDSIIIGDSPPPVKEVRNYDVLIFFIEAHNYCKLGEEINPQNGEGVTHEEFYGENKIRNSLDNSGAVYSRYKTEICFGDNTIVTSLSKEDFLYSEYDKYSEYDIILEIDGCEYIINNKER